MLTTLPWLLGLLFGGIGIKRTEAMAIEDMIADRRQRLAILRSGSPDA
jgi:hypothetical protein